MLPLLVLVACTSEFDPGSIGISEKAVLYCLPCAGGDTTLIQLSRSLPVSGKGETGTPITDARFSFTVNGTEQAVHYAATDLPSVPAGCYYVTGRWREADHIRIRAEVAGSPVLSSETTVPAAFPLEQVETAVKQGVSRKLQFRITFRHSSETVRYYGVRLLQKSIYERPDEQRREESLDVQEPELEDEPLLRRQGGLDEAFDLSNNFYRKLCIWSDEQVEGSSYTLRLNVPYLSDWEAGEWNRSCRKTLYKLEFYSLSEELYRYLKSVNDTENNDLGKAGLAPLRRSYTNVEHGLGVVGACNRMETGWMENERHSP